MIPQVVVLDTNVLIGCDVRTAEYQHCHPVVQEIKNLNCRIILLDDHVQEFGKIQARGLFSGAKVAFYLLYNQFVEAGASKRGQLLAQILSKCTSPECEEHVRDDWFLIESAIVYSAVVISCEQQLLKCLRMSSQLDPSISNIIWLNPCHPADHCLSILQGKTTLNSNDAIGSFSHYCSSPCRSCGRVIP